MGLGRVRLEDGSEPTGFLCEALAIDGAEDITAHGSWLEYLAAA
jgi:allophanate hydrolase